MKYLSRFCGFLLVLGLVMPVQAQDTAAMIARVNELRASLGLAPYSWNAALAAAANSQASYLATSGVVSHTGPDGSSPRDRARAAGYISPWVSENIYVGGIAGIGDAMNFWVNSPVHYASLTSPNYTDIGAALAVGSTRSFVLVFGAPDTRIAGITSGGGNSGNTNSATHNANAAPARPSFVVGVDANGNIMHEIQPGDTLGDIALLYGYSWGDIPTLLTLNGMSENDIRELPIGGIFLVPRWDGTYTPSPPPADFTPSATYTPEATATTTATPTAPPTFTPTITNTPLVVAAANQILLPPVTYIAPTPNAEPAIVVSPPVLAPTPIPDAAPPAYESGLPLMIGVVIVVQAGIFIFAAIEFLRRRS
jgi:hypothetical protein